MFRGVRRAVKPARRPSDRGFTIAEVMIAATISSFVLAGVLSAFLMIGRSGFLASSYSEIEAEIRRGLAAFGEDARKAVDIHWNSDQSITLAVATATNATTLVTYAYDAATEGPTAGCFYRKIGDAASAQPPLVLIRHVAPTFTFQRFKLEQPGVTDNSAHSDLETKLLQVTLRASRTHVASVAANQSAISARYILRNKRVAN
jgi:prepilin-type N-terminal cleavage/methylation domain-containing protein